MALRNVRNQKGCALFNLTTEVRIENVNECMIANALVGAGDGPLCRVAASRPLETRPIAPQNRLVTTDRRASSPSSFPLAPCLRVALLEPGLESQKSPAIRAGCIPKPRQPCRCQEARRWQTGLYRAGCSPYGQRGRDDGPADQSRVLHSQLSLAGR